MISSGQCKVCGAYAKIQPNGKLMGHKHLSTGNDCRGVNPLNTDYPVNSGNSIHAYSGGLPTLGKRR